MILSVPAACNTCRFFEPLADYEAAHHEDFVPLLVDDLEAACVGPTLTTEPDTELRDYGKCMRNPPQFLAGSLNGDWPIIHGSRVCGEYRPNVSQH
jgi:hypothetical protein